MGAPGVVGVGVRRATSETQVSMGNGSRTIGGRKGRLVSGSPVYPSRPVLDPRPRRATKGSGPKVGVGRDVRGVFSTEGVPQVYGYRTPIGPGSRWVAGFYGVTGQ